MKARPNAYFTWLDTVYYVQEHHGYSKRDVQLAMYPKSQYYGYMAIDRAIRSGAIRAEWLGNKYALYPAAKEE